MYSKFCDTESARKVFDEMTKRDCVTWSSMIFCYSQIGSLFESLELLKKMYYSGFVPKPELIASVLSICDIRIGKQIHALVITDERLEYSVFMSTALVDLYLRGDDLQMGFCVFEQMDEKNEVSWTILISKLINDNQTYEMGIYYFQVMQFKEGIKPNRVTLISVLPSCSFRQGKEIHCYSFRHGFESEPRFSSALMHSYCKCEEALQSSRLIFERLKKRDVVLWSSIIKIYSQRENSSESLRLFLRMQMEGVKPNSITLLALISACTTLSSLSHGRGIHCLVFKKGFNIDILIANSLINMYSKCGCFTASIQTFIEMPIRDSVSWSSMISTYGLHGCGKEAWQLFYEMEEREIEIDSITFLAILYACNHTGLVKEAQTLFHTATRAGKIELKEEHYACYVDLLGRFGKLDDACEVVKLMPMKVSPRIWSSLVSACKAEARLEVAEMFGRRLIETEPENAANYTLLSMVYGELKNWVGVEEVRRVMRLRGLKKKSGFSRIE